MTDFWTPMNSTRARTTHVCDTCLRRIDARELYWRGTGNYDGRWIVFRQCANCTAITALYDPRDFDHLITLDAFVAWAEDRARDLSELRAQVQWRRQWRRHDGSLYAVTSSVDGAIA